MLSAFTSRLGYGSAPRPNRTTDDADEDDNEAPAFPLPGSIQRAAPSVKVPTFNVTTAREDDDDEDDEPNLPDRIDVDSLRAAPALSIPPLPKSSNNNDDDDTDKPKKKKRNKVFIEPGYSQLDWARLKKSGSVDLRRGVSSIQRITPRELAKHKSKDDCWQAYGGKVYDVTYFLKYHPGGVPQMMRVAGKDGTELFMKTHPWVNTDMMLDGCLIGFLVPDRPGDSDDSS